MRVVISFFFVACVITLQSYAGNPATQPVSPATTRASDNYDAFFEHLIAFVDEATKTLKPVRAGDDATAAIGRLRELADVAQELEDREKALGDPPEDRQEAYREKYGARIGAALAAYARERTRVLGSPVLEPILGKEIDRMDDGTLTGRPTHEERLNNGNVQAPLPAKEPMTQPESPATTRASDNFDAYWTDYIAWMDEITKACGPIKTSEDAKAAIPKLQELAEEQRDLRKRANALGEPSEDVRKACMQKYGAQIQASLDRSLKETDRIFVHPVLGRVLRDEIEDLLGFTATSRPSGRE